MNTTGNWQFVRQIDYQGLKGVVGNFLSRRI